MTISTKLFRSLAVMCALGLSATACSGTSGGGESIAAPEPDETAIAPNPDVKIGVLDNGLTYYVQSNDAPADGLSLRLVVNAGSMQQEIADSGSAHFLEHMLFNGTEAYPGNDLTKALERLGVEFGADSNAYTSFDETVYQLDIPNVDAAKQDIAFDVMAEWASAATITEADTFKERGVVREEARIYLEGSGAIAQEASLRAYTDGTAYENHSPIGVSEKILATDADSLRQFYDRWYRPDLMAIVAVGSASIDELESEVKEHFASLESRGDDQERIDPTVELDRPPVVDVVVDPSLPLSIGSVSLPVTNWGDETVGRERLVTMQQLNTMIISNRILDAAGRGDVEIQGGSYVFPLNRNQMFMDIAFESPDIETATEYVLTEIGQARNKGFTEQETEQAIAELQVQLDQALDESATTENPQLSDDYVDHFLTGSEVSSMETAHKRVSAMLGELTAADLSEYYRWELAQASLSVLVSGPDEADLPSSSNLKAALGLAAEAEASSTQTSSDESVAIDRLMTQPDAVEPITSQPIEEIDGTIWKFENGVTVSFVPNDKEAGKVEFYADSEGGFGGMSDEDALLVSSAIEAVMDSGVEDIDRSTYRRFVDRSTTELFAGIGDTHQVLVGSTGSSDIEILFQRIHLALTAPAIDSVALADVVENSDVTRSAMKIDAAFATANGLDNLLYRGDERFSYVPTEAVADLSQDKALDLYTSRFVGVANMSFSIAGDLETEQVADLAARYLGTLPVGEEIPITNIRPEPLSEILREEIKMEVEGESGGGTGLAYQTRATINNKTSVELRVLEGILNDRLFATAREELGATYGGYVYSMPESEPEDTITVRFEATGDPSRGQEILDVMIDGAESLAADGPTADEFERAKAVVEGDFSADPTNQDLLGMIPVEDDDDDEEPLSPTLRSEILAAVDAEDIQDLAARLFSETARAEVLAAP